MYLHWYLKPKTETKKLFSCVKSTVLVVCLYTDIRKNLQKLEKSERCVFTDLILKICPPVGIVFIFVYFITIFYLAEATIVQLIILRLLKEAFVSFFTVKCMQFDILA